MTFPKQTLTRRAECTFGGCNCWFFFRSWGFQGISQEDRNVKYIMSIPLWNFVGVSVASPPFCCNPGANQSIPAEVLGAIGMGGAKLLDCDQLAVKLLDRVCNPPSVLELHELGSWPASWAGHFFWCNMFFFWGGVSFKNNPLLLECEYTLQPAVTVHI